jgi:radical SAM protein with 4Fe4S-binding SPASM domain
MGEPTLNPRYAEMVSAARRRGIFVQTTTNGTLLGRGRGRELLGSGIDQIYVSIDGATAATHESIRAGSDFERLLAGIRDIVGRRGKRRQPILEAWCVAQAANAAELPALVELVAELGLDRLTVQHDLSDWGKEEFRERRLERQVGGELEEHLERAVAVAAEVGLPFAVHTGNRFDAARGERCPWPWYSTYVTVEGAVSPCCFLADPDTMVLGDLREQSFEEIWRGEPYRELRRQHEAGAPPEPCRQCYRNLSGSEPEAGTATGAGGM